MNAANRIRRAKVAHLFTIAELRPLTGLPVAEESTAAAEASAEAVAKVDGIYLQHPAHRRLFSQFDYLRALGRASPGPRRAMRLIAPSSAGKTAAIDEYIRIDGRRRDPEEGHMPVVSIKLDSACTTKRLITSCLDVFGDEYSDRSVETLLRKRLYNCFRSFRTELVFVDEVQHLNFRSSERWDPADALKRMLDDGMVSLVFSGAPEAMPLMKRNIQLANRMIAPGDIQPLDPDSAEDCATFARFVRKLDEAMVSRVVVSRSPGMGDPRVLRCLFVASGGFLGRVVNLVRAALDLAVRRRADTIELHDFSTAMIEWAVAQGISAYDPFGQGIPDAA